MRPPSTILLTTLLFTSATLMHATVIETILFDLSPLNPGSILSGSVILSDPTPLGGTVLIPLVFSDPLDYSFTSLSTTLTVASGTIGDTVRFSPVTFTNVSGLTRTNLSNINLTVDAPAQCAGSTSAPLAVPCQATGLWQDGDPASFTGKYFITSINIPEPGSGPLVAFVGVGLAFARRFMRRKS